MKPKRLGLAGKLAALFIDNKLTPLFIIISIMVGTFATLVLPREEEPQIVVPMIDIMVGYPGASAKEVETKVINPMEKLLWEISGVEYVYSTAMPGQALTIVRFYVNENEEDSLVKVYHKLFSNLDRIPQGVTQPLIRMRSIYDVPVLALTMWSKERSPMELRRMAAQVLCQPLKQVVDVSETTIIGGQQRQIRVDLDPVKLAGYNLSPGYIYKQLQAANQQLDSGTIANDNTSFFIKSGDFLSSAKDVANLVVGVFGGRPILLGDVATVTDGAEDPDKYVLFGVGPQGAEKGIDTSKYPPGTQYAAVTITVAKHKGANAINVVNRVVKKVRSLQAHELPPDVHITITRDYGATATEKSNELLFHMLLAIISVVVLIALALGFRESLVVALAVPVTLSLTILVFYLYHYTLNRVTLFALVFSIGVLVDDAIVIVENIVRHYRLPENKGRSPIEVTVEAVDEVGNPTILATMTVIAAILPMAFVRGMMGPYMEPIPIGASAAMIFSMFVAFIISPWASYRLLHKDLESQEGKAATVQDSTFCKIYNRFALPLLLNRRLRLLFLFSLAVLLVLVVVLFPTKAVIMKMLPFDNKSELQIIVNAPESYSLEQTLAAAQDMASEIGRLPIVTDYEVYAGCAAPFNFNGLVRHYYLRRGNNVADIQVNFVNKHERERQSHDIATALRPLMQKLADKHGVVVQVAEVPPGPPVMATIVAEIYGPDYSRQIEIARKVAQIFKNEPSVADVDTSVEDDQIEYKFVVDKHKAALNGIDADQVVKTLAMAVHGYPAGLAHIPTEEEQVPIVLRLPLADRSSLQSLSEIRVQAQDGRLIPLSQLVEIKQTVRDKSIYHKNLQPVVYVYGEAVGPTESPLYSIFRMRKQLHELKLPEGYSLREHWISQPFNNEKYSIKWDGEWQITYEVFRDLGIAFAAVLLLIYALVTGWFQSFLTPIAILAVVPLSLIGIVPSHWGLHAFFTANSMIGFIAGAGIVVRNSIILVDFVELRYKAGLGLVDACLDAGVTRFRPILLTALAVTVASIVILFDPIFQGMAISLMAGEVSAIIFSPLAVPLLYYELMHRKCLRPGGEAYCATEVETEGEANDEGGSDDEFGA